jgi:CBS domain-containing protein
VKSVDGIISDRQVVTIDRSTCVLEAARKMTAHQIGALPVVERDGGDRLVGIFTERDILARVVATSLDPATTSVGDCMSTPLITADVGEPYEICLERMRQNHVRHLVVLAEGRLAGILSLRDLMAVDLNEKSEAISLLNAYVHDRPVHSQ